MSKIEPIKTTFVTNEGYEYPCPESELSAELIEKFNELLKEII